MHTTSVLGTFCTFLGAMIFIASSIAPLPVGAELVIQGQGQNQELSEREEEAGVMTPRGMLPSDDRATQQRLKVRALQQENKKVEGTPPASPPTLYLESENLTGAARQRSRAKFYSGTGAWGDLDLSQKDKDGVPLIECKENNNNISGRIGDDSSSGAEFFLARDGRKIKVRCR